MRDGCKQCGECCKWVAMHFGDYKPTESDIMWFGFHGAMLYNGAAFFPVRCSQLTEDNKCKLYGKPERPQACVSNPTAGWKLSPPGCRFFAEEE